MQRRNLLSLTALPLLTSIPLTLRAQTKTRLTVAYTAVPDFAAAFIAKERGYFDRQGLDVTLQLIPLAPSMIPALLSGGADVGGVTPPTLLQAVESGLEMVAVAGGSVYEASKMAVAVVAGSASAITDVKGLEGKKVGVPGLGGTLHVLARRWIERKGISAKRVSFIELPIPQMPDVLKGGGVDAVVTAEPFVTRMLQSGIGTRLPGFAEDLPDGFSNVLFACTRKWANANPQVLLQFRSAMAEAVVFAKSNETAARDDLAKYFKVPAAVLKITPFPHLQMEVSEAQLNFWVETMRAQDMLKAPIRVGSLLF